MIKLMLINPPQEYYKDSMGFNVYFPLSLLSVAAAVKEICEVRIFDCLVSSFEVKRTGDSVIYGTPFDKIEKAIRDYAPDIVGITAPFTTQSQNAVKVSRLCKKISPDITVVMGGADISVSYRQKLENDECDYCVIGEGEETFYEFIKNFRSKSSLSRIEGLASKEDGQIKYRPRRYIEDLDSLPFPAYELIDFDDYLRSKYLYLNWSTIGKNSISMITSRGCPYNCVFCSVKLYMGQRFRANSPGYVIRHLKHLKENYGITNFHFEDDNMSFDRSRFEGILDGIIENRLDIRWDTPNGIHAGSLDPVLLEKIKRSGCRKLIIAIESGNQSVLDHVIKKSISLESVLQVVKDCRRLGIDLGAFYVIGFPGETIGNMKETVDLALELFRSYNVTPYLFIATPLYGTELYDECVKRGIIDENITGRALSVATQACGEPMIFTEDFSTDDVKSLVHDYYRSRLRYERIKYSVRHPVVTLSKVKDKPALLLQKLLFSK